MNAHTPFRLESPAITDLSRRDLSDAENVKDAAHELRRCLTPGDFELWAKAWGENLCRAAEEFAEHKPDDFVTREELRDAERDADRAHDQLQGVHATIKSVLPGIEAAGAQTSGDVERSLASIYDTLEAALDA